LEFGVAFHWRARREKNENPPPFKRGKRNLLKKLKRRATMKKARKNIPLVWNCRETPLMEQLFYGNDCNKFY